MKLLLLAAMAAASTMALEVKTIFVDVEVLRRAGSLIPPTTGNQLWVAVKSKNPDAALTVKVVAGEERAVICSTVERTKTGSARVCVADVANATNSGAEVSVEE